MANDEQKGAAAGYPVREVWVEYEKIAMHFNDLLLRLRTQALGAVAAISALVGILSKPESGVHSWEISAAVFFFLAAFWVAIWVIDFRYYNLLLIGAVDAIIDLEAGSKDSTTVNQIDISIKIERAVEGTRPVSRTPNSERFRNLVFGRRAFYVIVFVALMLGLIVSLQQAGLITWFFHSLSGAFRRS